MKLQVGDKVQLHGNPFDEQIPEELLLYMFISGKVLTITEVQDVEEEGTTGQWVKTDLTPDWIDKAWFVKL